MVQEDLAGREYWSGIYRDSSGYRNDIRWQKLNYDWRVIATILISEIDSSKPKTVLEVGCGNSLMLPYLALQSGVKISGIDYSQEGCDLAKKNLTGAGVAGHVLCGDIWKLVPEEVGQYDLVYSLGLAEHFSDLEGILKQLTKFVKPGGVLLTEIPNTNFWSIHRFMSWLWHPYVFYKHKQISLSELKAAYENVGMEGIRGAYSGLFSLDIVGWEIRPRWPFLKYGVPVIRILCRVTDALLKMINCYKGIAPLAPFIYVRGKKVNQE